MDFMKDERAIGAQYPRQSEQPDDRSHLICTPQAKPTRQSRIDAQRDDPCDSVERMTTETFDRLSVDHSGFGPNHRDDSDDDSSDRDDGRESCTTTGFDFYVGKLNNMQTGAALGASRERNLFSPPFKTRDEMEQAKQKS